MRNFCFLVDFCFFGQFVHSCYFYRAAIKVNSLDFHCLAAFALTLTKHRGPNLV